MALGACLLGYGEVGLWLQTESRKPDTWVKQTDNPYRKWMDEYAGENYQSAVKTGIEVIEECARMHPPSRRTIEEWTLVWAKCTRFEKAFWDMSLEIL
jgi:hydroxymethylpyrimidine/phosphomethylpyrimidine kinase